MKTKFWNNAKIYLSKKDKVLKLIISNYSKENLIINNNYFICLVNSIIGQQISVSAANSIKNKFFSLYKVVTPYRVINTDIRNGFNRIGNLISMSVNKESNTMFEVRRNQFIKLSKKS